MDDTSAPAFGLTDLGLLRVHHSTTCCNPLLEDVYGTPMVTPEGAAAFRDFIQHAVAPFLAAHLPLDATDLVLAGASFGGVLALCTMLRRPTRRPSHQQPKETE